MDNAKDTAMISITVVPLPNTNSVVANNDEGVTLPNTSLTSNLFPNDDDPDNSHTFSISSFKFSTISAGSLNGNGALNKTSGRLNVWNIIGGTSINGEWVPNAGTITINSTTGEYTFVPATDFWGTVEITYTITDPLNATSTAILVIKIVPDRNSISNDPPIATDDFQLVTYNTTYTSTAATNALVNDKDPNGDPISATAQTTTNSTGTFTMSSNGSFSFTPAFNFTGYTSFNYQIIDNGTGLTAEAKVGFLVDDPTALPVTGLLFYANLNQQIVTLNWSTQTEINSKYYVIERSLDNIKFEAIGVVTAAGNSFTLTDYSFKDDLTSIIFAGGYIFYRLKQVDIDDQFTYSKVVVVSVPIKAGIKIWPNPVSSTLSISIFAETHKSFEFFISDVSGKAVRRYKQTVFPGSTQITWSNLENLPAGVYFVEIYDITANSRSIQRFVKVGD
jgi:hypothetical protein